jgi:hypothetical protein
MTTQEKHWPSLPLDEWQDTYETLHLWSQILGKIRLSQMPWINHSWHVPFYVTVRGLTTSLIPYGFLRVCLPQATPLQRVFCAA